MSVDENGVVSLSDEWASVRATPAEDLFLLAELDAAISDLKKKIEEDKRAVVFYAAELEKTKKELEAHQHALKERQRTISREEADIAELSGKRKQFDGRLLKIVSPKELAAIQDEIRAQDAAISAREEKLLGLYEEQEAATKAGEELAAKLERMTRAVAKKSAEKRTAVAEQARRITRLDEKRGDYLVKLDPDLSARYEKAIKRHGAPVAFTIDENACGGCGWPAPSSGFNRLRQNPGKPFECDHCGRLLVWVGAQGD